MSYKKGFTLLEILLVIGIIGILAAIVIIAINPGRSLAKTRDLQRKVGITEINKGINQYYIDNGYYPSTITPDLTSICPTGANATSTGINCTGMIDLSMLVPTYLPSIPVDPTGVGYKVGVNGSRHVMLVANLTELGPPYIAIGTTTSYVADTNPIITLGQGTVEDPYQINNWSQLNHIRDEGYLDKSYILMSSLTSATFGYDGIGNSWVPVGVYGNSFSGNFNGQENTISDLIVNLPSTDSVGFFGYVTGNISNIGLTNVSVTGNQSVGGLVGVLYGGTITNSHSTGTVTGNQNVGGLIGATDLVIDVSNSYSTGSVIATGIYSAWAGGLIGFVQYSLGANVETISNSYSTSDVTGFSQVCGGLIGAADNMGTVISNSFSTGLVNCSTYSSGFLGTSGYVSPPISISGSFWDKNTSEQPYMCQSPDYPGCDDTKGKTTAEMKIAATYIGWDTDIWNLVDGSYPTLK
ncbi:MAG: GLUG motif-containing protein [bacterium]